jgi:hypothetical protein
MFETSGDIALGPNFDARLKATEHIIKAVTDINTTPWGFEDGNYGHNLEGYYPEKDLFSYTRNNREVPSGFLSTLAKLVDDLLRICLDKPVILMDIGAGKAATWGALSEYFQIEINEGKLILIATNLESSYNDEINKQYSRVRTLQGTTDQLLQTSIDVNEHHIPIRGNIAFVHERNSVTDHSVTPEIDMNNMAQMLSENGTYSPGFDAHFRYEEIGFSHDDVHKAKLIGYKAIITRFNLREVLNAEAGPHQGEELRNPLLQKSNAPKMYF